ncbi:unnamed protein product [Adineta steineri]|uniref:Uncharacterized protein n=2 Tax=Adineta steineri TaxID=433720 RepID=A0A819I4U1_9BILA|nr:unnamed protein product [Adineta steineri]CAF4145581.1 unnamed protein product [Adineta steineri]
MTNQPSTTNQFEQMDLASSEKLFMQYANSLPLMASKDNSPTTTIVPSPNKTSTSFEVYQIRTLGQHNMARMSILPIFSLQSSEMPHLLLANVPLGLLTDEQYARTRHQAYPPPFKLVMHTNEQNCDNSYIWYLYQNLFVKTKKHLNVDKSIINFNLNRLHNCVVKVAEQYGLPYTTLNIGELPLALEFYLQIDVDMFFLKTCSFNGVQPRQFNSRFREGLFCINPPEARYTITPCNKRYCICCRYSTDPEKTSVIPFGIPHIHHFVNEYEAILNCPATCETKNCIYVLTCTCGKFDYVGQSKLPFATTLATHQEEGNRIIREFLIGETNCEYITHGFKSDEKKANDKLWLYQHSPRCSIALQRFLDTNPDYWCFVPMKLDEINLISTKVPYPSDSTTSCTRTIQAVSFLVKNVPKPPLGYGFSINQRRQQAYFFASATDCIVPLDKVDLYNANIVAVLPDHCSKLFRLFIQSLFITHAECKLNQVGHLVYEYSDPNYILSDSWYINLARPPLS